MAIMELVKNNIGIARLPCYVADFEPDLRWLDLPLTNTEWGIWILSHTDLKSTARVRACRDFLIGTITSQQYLIEGKTSFYWHQSFSLLVLKQGNYYTQHSNNDFALLCRHNHIFKLILTTS